jgi:signal transduction histidine kinase
MRAGDDLDESSTSIRIRDLGVWFATVLAIGLLMFTYHHLAVLADGESRPFLKPFINELTAAFGAGLLFWPLRSLTLRFPLDRGRALRHAPVFGVALLLFSAVHTSLNWGLRSVLYPLAGLGPYNYGRMPLRYFMEFPVDVILFCLTIGGLHAFRRARRARERELQAARLEHTLSQAHLRNLQLQLQPHFLFNALNTISSMMYRDVERADAMIERLADLLRASLRTSSANRVPLHEELAVLDDYLAIMRARFSERLDVEIDVEDPAFQALVPPLVLQPLVENAIRHGGVEARGSGRIVVRARCENGSLAIAVEDDGPGPAPGIDPLDQGLGLRTTAERLRLLYGHEQQLTVGAAPNGGCRVALRVPFVLAEAP